MKPHLNLVFFLVFLSACNSAQTDEKQEIQPETKVEIYYQKMKEKNFQLVSNGPCEDALQDTTHERNKVYVTSEIRTDSSAIIAFEFIESCCQSFLGDYTIYNDTLTFSFEQVNDEVCSCLCWYRYKLFINESIDAYDVIDIVEKK
jgi:hypothetical protein